MTPFDAALRVQQREVDALKVSISVEVERVTALEDQGSATEIRLRDERALATALPFACDAWTGRMKAERNRLREAAAVAQTRLGHLRAQAVEAYGTMRAIEGAAERHRDEADRAAGVAEQGKLDDIAAARFLAARREQSRTA